MVFWCNETVMMSGLVERKMMYSVLALLCFGQVIFAGPQPFAGTYASIAFSADEIRLPLVSPYGQCSVDVVLDCHFFASCPYQVNASFAGFTGLNGTVIGRQSTTVHINGVSIPVGGRSVPLFFSRESTPRDGIDVPLEIGFSFMNLSGYAGGAYSGEITLTVFGSG